MYSMTEQLSHQGVLVIRMHARVVAVRIFDRATNELKGRPDHVCTYMYVYLDEERVVRRDGEVGEVGPKAHPCRGEGDGEEHVDEEVELRVPDPELLEHLAQVEQRAGDLGDEQAGDHLRPAAAVREAGADADDADEVVHGVVEAHVAVEVAACGVVHHVRQRDGQSPHLARGGRGGERVRRARPVVDGEAGEADGRRGVRRGHGAVAEVVGPVREQAAHQHERRRPQHHARRHPARHVAAADDDAATTTLRHRRRHY
jgi:hypothetical protein